MMLLHSCELINPAEDIPSYIHIDSILLSVQPDEGTASHKISDAWVYVDDELIGTFETPCTVPVLKDGAHRLTIRAGIKSNGIASTRPYYPFYDPYTIDNFMLVKDSVINVRPMVRYASGANIAWKEGFEDGGISLMNGTDDTTRITKTDDPSLVFEGNYSAFVKIWPGDTSCFFVSTDAYRLPVAGYTYLELNYKNNNKFTVGLIATIDSVYRTLPVLVMNRSDKWNKIYINLTMMVYNYPAASSWRIFISSVKESETEVPLIYFDNLKLVYSR